MGKLKHADTMGVDTPISEGDARKSESQHKSRHNSKLTIIIYPKTMKVKPVVDIIEERYGGMVHADTKISKEYNQVTETNEESKEESPSKNQGRNANRSRN
jgi:hypothetical protein